MNAALQLQGTLSSVLVREPYLLENERRGGPVAAWTPSEVAGHKVKGTMTITDPRGVLHRFLLPVGAVRPTRMCCTLSQPDRWAWDPPRSTPQPCCCTSLLDCVHIRRQQLPGSQALPLVASVHRRFIHCWVFPAELGAQVTCSLAQQ